MSFWQLTDGSAPSGSDSASFASNYGHVPDGTQANAVITNFLPTDFGGEKMYQVTWRLLDGDFANTMLKQSINPFSQDQKKSDRAKNMLVRLYNLTDLKPSHSNAPTEEDLKAFIGKKCSVKAGNSIIEGKEKTWIREVHAMDKLEVKTGHTPVTTGFPDSALSRNSRVVDDLTNDIPF